MIAEIFIAFFLQIVFLFGPILLFGFLIALCNRRFYANFGSHGRAVCYVTGFLGTPLHELSHALMCLLFGHKIVEIKLFQVGGKDGTLGYVNHTYNRKNLYQRMGNFFIGIAPIVVISAVLYLLARLLMPTMTAEMTGWIGQIDFSSGLKSVLQLLFRAVGAFFSYAVTWQWWLFLLLGSLFALHMTLSGADIKGAWSGWIVVLLLLLLTDALLGLIDGNLLHGFTRWAMGAAGYLMCFFSLALFLDLVALGVSYLFRALSRK